MEVVSQVLEIASWDGPAKDTPRETNKNYYRS